MYMHTFWIPLRLVYPQIVPVCYQDNNTIHDQLHSHKPFVFSIFRHTVLCMINIHIQSHTHIPIHTYVRTHTAHAIHIIYICHAYFEG